MKKIFILLLIIVCLGMPIHAYSEEDIEQAVDVELQEEEASDFELQGSGPINNDYELDYVAKAETEPQQEQQIVEYDFSVVLENLYQYNIVALHDANITQHIRGSIWVGSTLTGAQYVDDGSLGGQAKSDSYVYNNMSQIYFRGRTADQSLDYYFLLSNKAVEETCEYWYKLMEDLPNGDETFIYLAPDKNGYVDARLWNYQASGSDETNQAIKRVYWTDATKVDVGGLGGHLIAPYADVNIVSSNNRMSVVGWNVNADGETHINYYVPKWPEPIEKVTPRPTRDVVRPTPRPIIPPTGDIGLILPLVLFIASMAGVAAYLLTKRKDN